MKNYLFLTYGFETPTDKIMEDWCNWFEEIQDNIIDKGGNCTGGKEITKSGTMDIEFGADSLTGYMIIEAENLDHAEKLAQGCPIITSIQLYELMS